MPICAISCVHKHEVWFKSVQGLTSSSVDRGITFCQHAILDDDPFVINDARSDPRFKSNPLVCGDVSLVFYAGIPIRSIDGLPIAAFCVIDTEPRFFDKDDLEMLRDFAMMAQEEMHTKGPNRAQDTLIQNVSSSWRLSMIDPLTRLWNHDGIITILGESLDQAQQSNASMFSIMLDLKNFHALNSELGQVAGDEFLRRFSKELLRTVGDEHIVGRLFSDKFAILMNTITDLAHAREQLDRIQDFVESFPIDEIDGCTTLGGAIAGVLVKGDCVISPESVFEHLDEAIYLSKQTDEYRLVMIRNNESDRRSHQDAA